MSPKSPDFVPSPVLHRALLFGLLAAALPVIAAGADGFRPQPDYVAGAKPDQAEGARILGEFQQAGIAGTYWLAFELRVLPRKGAGRTVAGEMLGTRGEHGPLTRLSIANQRWLIEGGPQPAAWHAADGAPAGLMSAGETLQPVAGTDLTLFDLQMPFLHWTDFVYEGLARIRGRPAHSFVLYPPAALTASRPDLTGVRLAIDTQFQALVQAELLGTKGDPTKTITILDLKKVGEQWMVKSIDLRNHLTRDKTRFNVTAAALDLTIPAGDFAPDRLTRPPPPVPAEKIQRF